MKLIKKNKLQIASIIILLIIFLVLSFQTYNKANRPDGYDFKSYLISSKALWEGSNPYVTGSSFPYIYPLFLTVLLIPLTQISYNISVYIWFIINVVSLIYSIDYLFRNCDKYNRSLFYGIPLLLLFLLTLNILQNNFLNGQVNILVLFFSVLYFYFFSKDKLIIASFFLSAAIAIKLVPLIFLLLVFRKEKISVLFYTAIISSVFIFLLPFVFTGSNLFEYYKYYLDNFLSKSLNNTTGSHDMFYTLNGFLNYILPSLTGFTWIKYISALFIVLLVMSIDYRWVKNNFKVFGIHIFSLYAICILFISPMSETHHLVFILPGLSLILYELIIKKRVKELYLLISFIFFIVLFWTGEITRSVPFHFTALIILFTIISLEIKKKILMITLLTRYKKDFIFILLISIGFSFLVSLFLLQVFAGILITLYLFEKNINKKRSFDSINLFFLVFILIRIISIFFSVNFDISVESLYKDALFYLGLFAFSYYFKALGYSRMKIVFSWYIVFASVIALISIIAFNLNYWERATSIFLGTSSYTNQLFVAFAILLFAFKPDISNKKDWVLWSIKGAIILSGVILNFSRSDTAVAVLIIFSAIFLGKLKLKPTSFFLVTTIIISSFSIYNNSTMMGTRFEQGKSTSGRSVIWQSAFDKLWDRPLLGHGPRTFNTVFIEYDKLDDKFIGSWHNDYITITMESGFIGLTSYLTFIFFIFYSGFTSLTKITDGERKNFLYGFMVAIAGMFLSALFSGLVNNPNLSVLFVFIVGAYTSLLYYHTQE